MDLRRLRYFVAVAEEGNFTRAAARLHMAQPPLSRQIMELERELNTTLLVRSPRALHLTDAGAVLLHDARELLAQADKAREAVQRAGRGETGELRVGFVVGFADDFLPKALSRYRSVASGVAVELHDLSTPAQVDALLDGRIHIGIIQNVSIDGRVRTHLLRREPMLVVLPVGHPLADRPSVCVEELATETLILGPEGLDAPVARPLVDECTVLGVHLRVAQQVADRKSVSVLVASGVGVTIILGPRARRTPPGVVTRPLVGRAPLFGETVAAWSADGPSLLVSPFVDAVVWAAAETESVS